MKPILCLDFDGVIHSYVSGWKGADVVPDPPVPGALAFIHGAVEQFRVCIFSSRSHQDGGLDAMQTWLRSWVAAATECEGDFAWLGEIEWPVEKPPALVTIDDRALTFSGNRADYPLDKLAAFKPWNKR